MNHFILECQEGSRTAGQLVSHFYKVENSVCTCVFCGAKVEKDYFNQALNHHFNASTFEQAIGQRS